MRKGSRESSIEALKVFSIFIIIISHCIQSLYLSYKEFPAQEYLIDFSGGIKSIQLFVLVLFRSFGPLGNMIFFVCSAWFLLSSHSFNKEKWFRLIVEIWVVSIIILTVVLLVRHGDVSKWLILKSLFPSTFSNNWYLSCYLLFYPLHPILNEVIESRSQRGLLRLTLVVFILH